MAGFADAYRRLPASLKHLSAAGVPVSELAADTGLTGEHVSALLTSVSTREWLEELVHLAERLCLALGTQGDDALTRDEASAWIVTIRSHRVRPHRAGGAGPVPSRARPAKGLAPEAADADELLEMLEDYLARALKYLRDVASGRPAMGAVRGELTAVRYVLDYIYPILDAV
ncbi:hypothetical protein [Streptomyces nanshensis]|uniref:Uncharacterized protein n=1 Tax=Streptomyces nanshensis TaxID=518642 RepID=A0A1E7L363_9ACTN|nr:hypothetical protein [Streptomyces nanshensis]OEV10561.1 hypothetical protein AN218_17050 [Streptomyces nanshensis]